MTRHDKKQFIRETQNHIIQTYMRVFQDEMGHYLEIDAMPKVSELSTTLKKRVVDMLF